MFWVFNRVKKEITVKINSVFSGGECILRIINYLKKIITVVALMLPLSLCADELSLNEDAPKSYIVKKGDTLWDISGIFLKQPWLWPKLWRLNPEVSNPHLIYPGEELRLVFDENGEPMLVKGKPELKWSPSIRKSLKDLNPISILPLHIIAPYIKYDTIADEDSIEDLPYVLGSEEGYRFSAEGLNIYVTGSVSVGRSYAVYKQGGEIVDPESEDSLGIHLILIGTAKALREGNAEENIPATLYLDNAKQEIQAGDIVLPLNEKQVLPATFKMQAAPKETDGRIIKSLTGLREFGKFEVVMINRGQAHQIKEGNVLAVKRQSPGVIETSDGPINYEEASMWARLTSTEEKSDYKMPLEDVGKIMVFRTYEQVSLALILGSQKPLRLNDTIVSP